MVRPVGESVALPRMRRARDPQTPELADVFGRLEEGLRRRILPGVQELARERGVGPDVVPRRHEDVARIPPDVDVLRAVLVTQAVQGEVALQEAPVPEALDDLPHLGSRNDEARVRPGRHPVQRFRKLDRLEDEEAHDALGPGRPGLERGRDDDVVGTGNDVVPAHRVEMMALVDAGALREGPHTIKYARPEPPRKRTRPLVAGESRCFMPSYARCPSGPPGRPIRAAA